MLIKRSCVQCRRGLPRTNATGVCRWCFNRGAGLSRREGKINESSEHRNLKETAVGFLESIGCISIRKETLDISGKTRNIHDVVGFDRKTNKLVVVECGGSYKHKLEQIVAAGHTLFVLPHGYETPYLYSKGMSVCRVCGHNKSRPQGL